IDRDPSGLRELSGRRTAAPECTQRRGRRGGLAEIVNGRVLDGPALWLERPRAGQVLADVEDTVLGSDLAPELVKEPPPDLRGEALRVEIVGKPPGPYWNAGGRVTDLKLFVEASFRSPVGDDDRCLRDFEPARPTDVDVPQVPGERPGGLAHDRDDR